MARKWSGFLPLNQAIKEEWELLEACEAQARLAEEFQAVREEAQPILRSKGRPPHPNRVQKSTRGRDAGR